MGKTLTKCCNAPIKPDLEKRAGFPIVRCSKCGSTDAEDIIGIDAVEKWAEFLREDR